MDIGIIVPQGITGEYAGWQAAAAWARTVHVAHQAERLGFESIWALDHLHTVSGPREELTFEAYTTLTALAALTTRVRLGHIVLCTAFRNPALIAKMVGTLDVVSGGRAVLGLGAGWNEEEFVAYGFDYRPTPERLAVLADHLEVVTRMLAPGRATFDGANARVHEATNVPRGLQEPRVPIMVGGNGPNVTWRLAARHADELNFDNLSVAQVRDALPVVRARCEEIGRDPATLALSVNIDRARFAPAGQVRVDLLGDYRDLGLSRVQGLLQASTTSDEPLEVLAADARAAGIRLHPAI